MAPLIIQGPVDTQTVVPLVYTRASWSDPWVFRQDLHCLTASHAAATSLTTISEAELQWEYGELLQGGGASYQAVTPLDILHHWVKIEWINHTPVAANAWYGIAVEQRLDDFDTSEVVRSGTQRIRCLGPEWLLTRHQVVDMVIPDQVGVPDSFTRIREAIAFNDYRGLDSPQHFAGNQATVPVTLTVPTSRTVQVFDTTMNNPRRWNAKDIVEYLLAFHTNHEMASEVAWELSLPASDVLAWFEPRRLDAHGRTVFELIASLVHGRRGLVWWVEVDEGQGIFRVKVETMVSGGSPLVLPGSGASIPPNSNQVEVSHASNSSHVDGMRRAYSRQEKFSQVEVEGARRGLVTLLTVTDELLPAWTATEETNYASATDKARMYDPDLRRVYTHYVLDSAWDGAGLLTLGLDGTGDTGTVPPFWRPGIKFESYLPLRTGYDYTTNPEGVNQVPAGQMPEFIRPTATVELPDGNRGRIDQLSSQGFAERGDSSGLKFNCRLHMMHDQPGVVIDPNGGPAHLLAKGTFSATNTDYRPILDYRTLHVLVYMTLAERVRVRYPHPVATETFNDIQRAVIRLGDRLHVDFCDTSTISGQDSVVLGIVLPNGNVRDDRPQMRDVARMSFDHYYGRERKQIAQGYSMITALYTLGQLITQDQFGEATDAVVTEVRHNFPGSRTEIKTQFAELDFADLI